MIAITNVSNRIIKIGDLGNTMKYGVDGILAQNVDINPGESFYFFMTDELRNSILAGDISKFVSSSMFVLHGTGFILKTTAKLGVAGGHSLGVTDVVNVLSVIALNTSTGAYAAKALLETGGYTSDYYVQNGEIILETDQTGNTLLVTYESV